MKSNEEMYQSLLSRRNAYRRKKERQSRIIRRTVPVAAVFCLSAVLGISYWSHLDKPPAIQTIPESTGTETVTTTETTQSDSTVTTAQSTSGSNPVTQTEETESMPVMTITTTETTATIPKSSVPTMKTTIPLQTETTAIITVTTQRTTASTAIKTQSETAMTTESGAAHKPDNSAVFTDATSTHENDSPGTNNSQSETTAESPVVFSAQPIGYQNTDAVMEAINLCDVSGFPEDTAKAYEQMYTRIKADGFLYTVTDTDEIKVKPDWCVNLYPYAAYEDIGVGYYIAFRDKSYMVMFYCADERYIPDSGSLSEYLPDRMGQTVTSEIPVKNMEVSIRYTGRDTMTAGAFIDRNHYFQVVAHESDLEELLDFLNGFSFEKLKL